jgi:hypothetical protein
MGTRPWLIETPRKGGYFFGVYFCLRANGPTLSVSLGMFDQLLDIGFLYGRMITLSASD